MSGGPWLATQIGTGRPGPYINFLQQALHLVTNQRGIVAMIVRSAWGPDNTIQEISGISDAINYYGVDQTGTYNAYYSLQQALLGGAEKILTYRIEGSGGVKSALVVNDAAAAPAITFNGKYNGTRGNSLTLTTQANAVESTKTDVILYDSGVRVASWTTSVKARGVTGHMAEICAMINNDKNNYLLSATLTGLDNTTNKSTPASVTASALASGADAAAATVGNYSTALTAFQGQTFNTFHADILDADLASSQSTIKAWIAGLRADGIRVQWVTGSPISSGTIATDITAAIVATTDYNSEAISYVYPGVKQTNYAGVLTTYRGSAFAAQIAGAISNLVPGKGLTYLPLQGVVDVEVRLTSTQIKQLLPNGVLVLNFNGSQCTVEKGQNTLITPASGQPSSMKKIAITNTLDAIATAITTVARDNYIGKYPNDAQGQNNLMSDIRSFLAKMAGIRAIKSDYTVELDPDPNHPSTGDTVFIVIGIIPVDTMDYIYFTVNVGV